MGDSKMLKRFHEFCDAYKANRSIEGTVEEFDTIWYIEPERSTRGMTVRTESETKYVVLPFKRKPPIEIGDHVIIAGLESKQKKKTVIPAVLLNSTRRYVLFLKDIREWGNRENLLWNSPEIIGLFIIGIGLWIASASFFWMVYLGSILYFGLAFPKYFAKDYLRRSRIYSCDNQTLEILTGAISSRFSYLPMV